MFKFFRGSIPLLTKGSLATFFGGPEVIKQLANDPPSPAVLIFFINSILLQTSVLLYKKMRKYKLRSFQTYMQELRTNLGKDHFGGCKYNSYSTIQLIMCSTCMGP